MSKTSERHVGILNELRDGDSRFGTWVRENLGAVSLVSWEWGRATFLWDLEADGRFLMGDGVMFGGHISSVGDHVAAIAAMTVLEGEGQRFRTSRLETQFFRPVMKPRIDIEARVVNTSRSLIHIEADYRTPADKLAVRVNAVQVRRQKPTADESLSAPKP